MQSDVVEGGFSDPVLQSGSAFRAIMEAIARPGSIRALPTDLTPPAPLSAAAAAVALTLCDHDTVVWLDDALSGSEAVKTWLAFHAGVSFTVDPSEACFALVSAPGGLATLDRFPQGTQEYPDRSATLVLQVENLTGGGPLVLAGPGIETSSKVSPTPMPRFFSDQWRRNRDRFPRGIDLILAAPEGVACLPRTTRIELSEA